MTVSMRVMSAGGCYKYLLKSIAAGDGDRSLSASLTRYYAEAANPPGFWLGQGLASLGHGELAEGPQVSEAQLQLFIGMGHNPITGEALSRPYQQFASIAERIEQRVNALDPELGSASTRGRHDRGRGSRARHPPRGGRLRLHVQRPQVHLRNLGGCRCGHAIADRRVDRQAWPAALGANGAETTRPSDTRHPTGKADQVAGEPHPRLARARNPAARHGCDRLGARLAPR